MAGFFWTAARSCKYLCLPPTAFPRDGAWGGYWRGVARTMARTIGCMRRSTFAFIGHDWYCLLEFMQLFIASVLDSTVVCLNWTPHRPFRLSVVADRIQLFATTPRLYCTSECKSNLSWKLNCIAMCSNSRYIYFPALPTNQKMGTRSAGPITQCPILHPAII